MSNEHRKLLLSVGFGLIFHLAGANYARRANVSSEVVWTTLNQEISLECKTDVPQVLQYCSWARSSFENPENPTLNVAINNSNYENYSLDTDGLARGECGMNILHVSKNDFGLWNCTLITERLLPFLGTVKVMQWEKPHSAPVIQDKHEFAELQVKNGLEITVNVTCCAHPGKPEPQFSFELETKPINSSILVSNSTADEICATLLDFPVSYRNNGAHLRCRMNHVSFSDSDRDTFEDDVQLNILFAPLPQNLATNSTVQIQLPFDVTEWNISAVIRGNPLPQLQWTFPESIERTNFVVHERKISTDTITTTLEIRNAQKLMPHGVIELTARNYYGDLKTTYEFNFTTQGKGLRGVLLVVLVLAMAFLTTAFAIGVTIWKVRRHRVHREYSVATSKSSPSTQVPDLRLLSEVRL